MWLSTRRFSAIQEELEALRANAVVDPVTGFVNRRGLPMLAEPLMHAARRTGDAIFCMIVTIEDHEKIASQLDAEAADEIVKAVGVALRTSVRGTDVIARWDGPRYCVVGPGPGASMLEVERRVRERLRVNPAVPLSVWDPRVRVGGSLLTPWDEGDLDTLLVKAELETTSRQSMAGATSLRRRRTDTRL